MFNPFFFFFLSDLFRRSFQVAQNHDGADGYTLFFGCSEWWRFKTPFYAWFSRSYESVLLPQLWDWGFTHGHASWRESSAYCMSTCFITVVSDW